MFPVVLEATNEARLRALEGPMSAQKVLKGSKTERRQFLEGTQENNIFPDERLLICPPGHQMQISQNYNFSTKSQQKQFVLVARTATLSAFLHIKPGSRRKAIKAAGGAS